MQKLQDGHEWAILRGYTPQRRGMAKITKELMESIAARMAVGESLLKIVEEKGMPTYDGIMKAITRDEDLYSIYREGRVKQAEFFSDHINKLAREPLPEFKDIRLANAEVQRRRLEIDSLKWTLARTQPFGIRDKKDDVAEQQSITITWGSDAVAVKPEGA